MMLDIMNEPAQHMDEDPCIEDEVVMENGTTDEKTNLIINYVPPNMSEAEIKQMFSSMGTVTSCKLIRNRNTGQSLGYAFVNYEKAEEAFKAVEEMNGARLQNKVLKVSFARPSSNEIKNANLYISGLPKHFKEEDVDGLFRPYGKIITSKVLKDVDGEGRGTGFVRFDKRHEAQSAIDELNNRTLPGTSTKITVKFANPPNSRQPQFPAQSAIPSPLSRALTPQRNFSGGPVHHQMLNMRYSPLSPTGFGSSSCQASCHNNSTSPTSPASPNSFEGLTAQGWCIFVYGLPQDATTLFLYKLFSPFGAITNVELKAEKGYGFINMRSYDEAYTAIWFLNGSCHKGKVLQVSFKTSKNNKQQRS
ncbi:ELAV-like protein 1-B [Exaiptasia diaphana]|uniref:RRM domain-containing protein n=1 Tax=Exaiptasia diaphana TaxID=2652724 RepID=A0A913YBC9_EXADI|nr:ELAV-like protein 1-B [Exaiptasia diaphana]